MPLCNEKHLQIYFNVLYEDFGDKTVSFKISGVNAILSIWKS